MNKDKIIAAAREAGTYADIEYQRRWESGEGGSWSQIRDERFYAIAYRQGLELAAEICEAIADEYEKHEGRKYPEMKSDAQTGASDCEYAIRAHAKNQTDGRANNG